MSKNLLKTKYADMTVADMLKVSGILTIASIGIMAAGYAVAYFVEKKEDEKWRASLQKKEEIDD